MAESINRVNFKGQVGDIPSVSVSTGAADAMAGLANTLNGFSMKLQDKLDTNAAVESARQGAIDGAEKQLDDDLMFNPTIRGKAYTQSAVNTYKTRVDLDARKKISEIAAKYPTDPNRMKFELDAYKTGVMESMLPDVKAAFGLSFDINSQASISGANKNMIGAKQKKADAEALALEHQLHIGVQKAASGALSADRNLRRASQDQILLSRKELVAKYSSTITDAFGNQVPAFDPKDGVKALHEFDQTVMMSGISGWYAEQVEKGRTVQAMTEFTRGGGPMFTTHDDKGNLVQVPASDGLTEKNVAKITTQMQAGIKFSNSQVKHENALSDRRVKETSDKALNLFVSNAKFIQRDAMMPLIMSNPNIDGPTKLKIQSIHSKYGLGSPDDVRVVRETRANILNGAITDPSNLPVEGLSDETRAEYENLILTTKDKAHFSVQKDYGSAQTYLRNYFGVPVGSVIGGNQSAKQKRVGEALVDLFEAADDASRRRQGQIEAAQRDPSVKIDPPFDAVKWARDRRKEDIETFGADDGGASALEAAMAKRQTLMKDTTLEAADRKAQLAAQDAIIAQLRSGGTN